MQHCCLSGLPCVLITLALWDHTLTLAVMLIGEYPAASVYSLFSCWDCAPTRLLKLVVRWRLSSVFWGGMFSSMASVSELNRGSNIWTGRTNIKIHYEALTVLLKKTTTKFEPCKAARSLRFQFWNLADSSWNPSQVHMWTHETFHLVRQVKKMSRSVYSQWALRAHHYPSGLAHTLPGPQTSTTPWLCGWTTGPHHWE